MAASRYVDLESAVVEGITDALRMYGVDVDDSGDDSDNARRYNTHASVFHHRKMLLIYG